MSIFNVSLDTANRVYNGAWYVSILSAGLTFFAIATVFWSDSIRDDATERAISNARVTAAQANERAASLEVQAEQARLAQRRLEESSLLLQTRLEVERTARVTLELEFSKIKPRSLSEQQIRYITESLIKYSDMPLNINLEYDINCPDGNSYARNITGIFDNIGVVPIQGGVMGPVNPPSTGLALRVVKGVSTHGFVDDLVQAFLHEHVSFNYQEMEISQLSRFSDQPLVTIFVSSPAIR